MADVVLLLLALSAMLPALQQAPPAPHPSLRQADCMQSSTFCSWHLWQQKMQHRVTMAHTSPGFFMRRGINGIGRKGMGSADICCLKSACPRHTYICISEGVRGAAREENQRHGIGGWCRCFQLALIISMRTTFSCRGMQQALSAP